MIISRACMWSTRAVNKFMGHGRPLVMDGRGIIWHVRGGLLHVDHSEQRISRNAHVRIFSSADGKKIVYHTTAICTSYSYISNV